MGNDLLVGNWNHRARKLKDLWGFRGGTVDEVMVFDRELSPLEIQNIYDRQRKRGLRKSDIDLHELRKHYLLNYDAQFLETQRLLDSLRALDLSIPHVMIMEERDTVNPTFVLARGVYDAKEKQVFRNTPESVAPFPEHLPRNRLGLAQWLFTDNNPLTARVMVNRLWQHCFGRGLVATPEDFGSQGDLPSHPELLDWLAVEFRESGWDIKHLLKLIVTSSTYRQASTATPKELATDKNNIWLARGPNQALSAEMLRDQALLVSGLLHDKIGGKWVKPYQPAGIWKELANQIGENKYRPSRGRDLYRRSVYTYWKRTIPPPTMLVLDAPERSVCTVKRQTTSTPLQALILLNDPQYVEAARVLATHLLQQKGNSGPAECIAQAFQLLTSRMPNQEEVTKLEQLFMDLQSDFMTTPAASRQWISVGATVPPENINYSKLAALSAVIATIFNLDESRHRS